MNSQQLQAAIDKYVTVIIENGTKLQQFQPSFYERLTSVTGKLMLIQAERAGMITKPITFMQNKNGGQA